jgi:tyrosine-protein phosphatase SIW14
LIKDRGRLLTRIFAASACLLGIGACLAWWWDDVFAKRVAVVEPGRIVRGAWQRPGPLRRIVRDEKIRTIVTLTAINRDDPKYVDQAAVVDETGVDWVIVPMRGSRGTVEQMADAADLMADPARQPVYIHCVAGHHRTGLAHAAYLIRHKKYSAAAAWNALAALPWTRPDAAPDRGDRALIEAFAASQANGTLR